MSNRIHQAAVTLALAALTTAHAFAFTLSPMTSQQTQLKSTTVTTSNTLTARTGGTIVRRPSGNVLTQLTTSDCRLGGGTVIVPGDDRCGSIGAAYCRYPDTMAACITQ